MLGGGLAGEHLALKHSKDRDEDRHVTVGQRDGALGGQRGSAGGGSPWPPLLVVLSTVVTSADGGLPGCVERGNIGGPFLSKEVAADARLERTALAC